MEDCFTFAQTYDAQILVVKFQKVFEVPSKFYGFAVECFQSESGKAKLASMRRQSTLKSQCIDLEPKRLTSRASFRFGCATFRLANRNGCSEGHVEAVRDTTTMAIA